MKKLICYLRPSFNKQ